MSLPYDMLLGGDYVNEIKLLMIKVGWQPTVLWRRSRRGEYELLPRAPTFREIDESMDVFWRQMEVFEKSILDLRAPLPYRMKLVEHEILRVFPRFPGILGKEAWNSKRFLLFRNKGGPFGKTFPFYEVYASGALMEAPDEWEPTLSLPVPMPGQQQVDKVALSRDLTDAYAAMKSRLVQLVNINEVYNSNYKNYFVNAKRAYGIIIEEVLFRLPREEILAIEAGQVEVLTLRTAVSHLEAQQETREETAPYRGRFGVILKLMVGTTVRYYQLFPLLGLCSLLQVDGPLRIGGEIVAKRVRSPKGGGHN